MLDYTPIDLPELGYEFAALEPQISAAIMELHYSKHHAAYVAGYNAAMEKYRVAEKAGDIAGMVALQSALKFHGGGHVNHTIFWKSLAPAGKGGGGEPSGALAPAIQKQFGSFAKFKEKLNALSLGIQGSGWGWLGYNKTEGTLALAACANQDPLSTQGLVPLLGIDVWEHAYYLQYMNQRAKYLEQIWQVICWSAIEQRFQNVQK